jgi:hypothetical protein
MSAGVSLFQEFYFMTTHPIRFGIASGQQLYEWAQLVELWKTADQLG